MPQDARKNPALAQCLQDVLSGANLVFRTEEGYVHNDPAVRRAWDTYYGAAGDGPRGICLVTGERELLENVHPAIKNVSGAQPSGAALVSFNAPAFCSYGKEQSLNAPTGKYAAFAYTAALNHLLADKNNVQQIGDTTVVCWAEGAEPFIRIWACRCCLAANTLGYRITSCARCSSAWRRLPCEELASTQPAVLYSGSCPKRRAAFGALLFAGQLWQADEEHQRAL